MKKTSVFIFLWLSINSFSQSISLERVNKIKSATVRIFVENSNSVGSGFFIDDKGLLVTAWHVIAPAIITNSNGKIIDIKRIFVTIDDTLNKEFSIPSEFFFDNTLNKQAFLFDFCMLKPTTNLQQKTAFLKLGNFDACNEGQEIITCGYPIGIPQKFLSRGIISTKFIDTLVYSNTKINRTQALLDITMNRGNSGGAIVLLGDSPNNDQVIGIADFIINPIGGMADNLIKKFDEASGAIQLGGVDPNQTFSEFTKILSSISIGVSGCISINHIKSAIRIK